MKVKKQKQGKHVVIIRNKDTGEDVKVAVNPEFVAALAYLAEVRQAKRGK